MKENFHISQIIPNLLEKIQQEKDEHGGLIVEIQNILSVNFDQNLVNYISLEIQDHILLMKISNAIVYSEIIGFYQRKIKEKLGQVLKENGIKDIRYKLVVEEKNVKS